MSLTFTASGPASAPTILFLHGGGIGGWMWRKQVAAFEGDYHCLVPTLPEQGQTSEGGEFNMASATQQVAELIHTHAHDGRAHVVGLSLGAQVGVALFAVAAQLLDRSLLSGALVRPLPGAGLVAASLKLYDPIKNWDVMIRANLKSLGVPDEYYAEFAADTRGTSSAALARIMTANMTFTLPPGLTRLTIPVLITVGEKELKPMKRSARMISGAMLGGQACQVRGQGHNWPLQAPDLFNRTLRAWLTDQPLPAELEPVPSK
jgi:pimeloyl-ACP methyl ester carboxylesterase